jgi:hypothetical protein
MQLHMDVYPLPDRPAIHGTTTGYSVMASAFEQAAGY